MQFRTDLALEAREIAGDITDGVEYNTQAYKNMTISKMKILNEQAANMLSKDIGTYITIELPPLIEEFTQTDKRLKVISENIRILLPKEGLILVAGIGNLEITPDALGPKTASQILATRHIIGEIAKSIGLDSLRPVAVMSPGVLGQTGIETGELILSVAEKIKPTAIIVIDALASRRLERLGCTMQISDTGIAPGAGIGNNRFVINKKTVGIPVIAVGVPTVVDAVTLATDLLSENGKKSIKIAKESVSPNGQKMVVTPREIDLLISRGAKLISMSLNHALQPDFEIEDLMSLV